VVTAIVASALALACSSVPDVHFVDGDAAASSSSGSTDSGAGDAAKDAAGAGDSGSGLPDWSCPSKPPPAGEGVCCGTRLCFKCTQADCGKCEQAGCAGTLSAACCPKNPVQMTCKAYPDC
jgi:hypothetical protein